MIPGPVRGTDFLAITGPTTSGKTGLSLEVARQLGGEIVSMDSRQVYRGMDLGTAKVTLRERALIPHHGLDLLSPEETYSAGQFARDAREWIQAIRGRRRVPVLVGGTGFFLRALTHPIFDEPPLDERRVKLLRATLGRLSAAELAVWVRALDPARADLATAGGSQRMIRTCTVALLSGRPLSWWHEQPPAEHEPLSGLVVLLVIPMEELDRRIRVRAQQMLDSGFVEEVATLVAAGFGRESPGMTGTGYRDVLDFLEGHISKEDAAERIRLATRQYARRQLTWFRRQLPAETVEVDATSSVVDQTARVLDAWQVCLAA